MATQSVMIAQYSISTDAAMRAAFTSFCNALVACGLVWDSSIPSQLDLTTAVLPSTANTLVGYRWYLFSDSLQASAPVSLRVAFYTSASSSSAIAFYVDAGQLSTPGVGSWKDGVSIRILHAPGYNFGTALNSLFSGDGSRLGIAMWRSPGFAAALGTVERIKDASGNDTPNGIMSYRNWTNNRYSGVVTFGTPNAATSYPYAGVVIPPAITSGTLGSDKILWAKRACSPSPLAPMLGSLSYFDADFTKGTPISVQCYDGLNHTFWPLGNDDNLNQAFDTPSPAATVYNAMRWE